MTAGEHLSAVRQRIAQLQRDLAVTPDTAAPERFRARLAAAMADTPVAVDTPHTARAQPAPATVTLGAYLGSPGLGRLARATAPPPAPTGPAFHGVALRDPVAATPGSGYGPRRHPILGTTRMHHGQDYGAATGAPITAAAPGTVTHAGERGGYGNLVEIDHGNGVTTRYAHASRVDVQVGDRVGAGQTVAAVGSTGLSTGPHLHFELRHDGDAVDPAHWLPDRHATHTTPAPDDEH